MAIQPKKYKQLKNINKLKNLKLGSKLLNKCDTCVEIFAQSNGEYVICASVNYI